MNCRLACADFTFPLLNHDNALDVIAMLGLTGVDVGLFEGRSHLHPSQEFVDRDAASRLRRKCADRGLTIADVFLQMDPDFSLFAANHPDHRKREKAREWFLRTIDYAKDCGSKHVTALPGVFFESESKADSWGRCCDELTWRVEQARDAGIVFGVEAHVGSIAATPAAAMELLNDVAGLTLTLDYTHFTRAGLPDRDIEPLLVHASHMHVRGAREGRLQSSFKENTIDYGRIVDQLKSRSYAGFLGIEYVWIDWEHCNEVDNLSETILFRDFLITRWQ